MRKLLNTLFVTTQGTYLRKEGQAIAVNRDKRTIMRLPLHNLSSIVVFGRVLVSPYLMHFCSENNIFIAFHREDGRFLARVEGPVSGNVLLRREQFRAADSPVRSAAVARNILLAKLANSKQVLLRFLRDHPSPENQVIEDAASYLKALMRKLAHGHEWDLELLRGMEGSAAERYFSIFDALIRNEEAGFRFSGRSRRPPMDPVNALLSFAYTLLGNEMESALESVGLDPAVGFLHRDRPGRASLALDLLEEFRAFLGDRLVLSLLNLKQLKPGDFEHGGNGAVKLKDHGRKTFLSAYQARKKELIVHPFTGEKVEIGLLFFIQARLLAKHLRGELPQYPPFVWR